MSPLLLRQPLDLGAQFAVRRRGRQQGTDNGEAQSRPPIPICVWQPPPVWSGCGPPSSIGRDGKFCGLAVAELARQRRQPLQESHRIGEHPDQRQRRRLFWETGAQLQGGLDEGLAPPVPPALKRAFVDAQTTRRNSGLRTPMAVRNTKAKATYTRRPKYRTEGGVTRRRQLAQQKLRRRAPATSGRSTPRGFRGAACRLPPQCGQDGLPDPRVREKPRLWSRQANRGTMVVSSILGSSGPGRHTPSALVWQARRGGSSNILIKIHRKPVHIPAQPHPHRGLPGQGGADR